MKHCPACNFSFPDFHLVCDLDGTELVSDRRHLALIKLPPQRSAIRRLLTSPQALSALAISGLFLVAALIAYQQTTSRATRMLLAANIATPALETPTTASRTELSTSSRSVSRSNMAAKAAIRARRSLPIRFDVRSRGEKHNEHPFRQTEIAQGSGAVPQKTQPKLVAMLKTTWRVLKRPFGF